MAHLNDHISNITTAVIYRLARSIHWCSLHLLSGFRSHTYLFRYIATVASGKTPSLMVLHSFPQDKAFRRQTQISQGTTKPWTNTSECPFVHSLYNLCRGGMTDEVFVDLQENRHSQHPKYIHQCDQLCKTCQVILTMGGVKMAEAPPFLPPTPNMQTGRVHLDEFIHTRFDYDECDIKANPT